MTIKHTSSSDNMFVVHFAEFLRTFHYNHDCMMRLCRTLHLIQWKTYGFKKLRSTFLSVFHALVLRRWESITG